MLEIITEIQYNSHVILLKMNGCKHVPLLLQIYSSLDYEDIRFPCAEQWLESKWDYMEDYAYMTGKLCP